MAARASAVPFVASRDDAPRPRRQRIAHAVWWVVIAVDALFFIVGVPGLYVAQHQPCTDASIECSTVQAPVSDFQVMLQRGQVEASAIFVLTVVVLVSLVFFAVGGHIAWRKWRDPMGLFVSAMLIAFGATLRQEVDPRELREHLVAVVEEATQPAHISLWLRQPDRS